MELKGSKVAILIESDFYENEIFYYESRFKEEGIEADFMSRLWGKSQLTFEGHGLKAPFICTKSFENMSDQTLQSYAAVIMPSGYVADRLRYTEDINKLPPATELMKRAFGFQNILKGIICHGMWIMSPVPELVKGRKAVVHNNILGDAKNMGIDYVNEDLVVDRDLITARTGDDCYLFAHKIIETLRDK